MNPEITKQLLYEHFRGNVSTRQRKLIDEWVQKPENEELYYKYLMEWELISPQYLPDVNQGIERFRSNIYGLNTQDQNPEQIGYNWSRYFPVVAASLLFVAISCGWLFKEQILYKQLSTGPNQIRYWVLPDGSRVNMNANSSLIFPRWGFTARHRIVHLTGEAEFAVSKQKNGQQFIVKTLDPVDVVVLGTEFTVYSRADKTQILLSKGKVQVQHQDGEKRKQTVMKPGERITFDHGQIRQNHFDKTAEYATWKQSRFSFNQTPLTEIARILKSNYGLTVEISSPELGELTISGSVKAMDHLELIQSVCQILDIQYKIKSGQVIFYENAQKSAAAN